MARPPWLPGEKKRRRVHLGRGKRHDEADERRDRPAKPEEKTDQAGPQRAEFEDVPPKRDRVAVSRRTPDADPESQAAPGDDLPEARPKRVAVPFDRVRRLQQVHPEPPPPTAELPPKPEPPPREPPSPPEPEPPASIEVSAPIPEKPAASADVPHVEEPEPPLAPDEVAPPPEPAPPSEASPESVEWVSEALARLEWQYDSLLAESLVKPEPPSEPAGDSEFEEAEDFSAEPDHQPVIEAPSEFAGAADVDLEPAKAEVLSQTEPSTELSEEAEHSAEHESDIEYRVELAAPPDSVSADAFEAEPDFKLRDEPELPATLTEPEAMVSVEQMAEPDVEYAVEPVAPVLVPEDDLDTEPDFELREEPELTVTEPVVESEPLSVASEPQWEPPPLMEPESVVEVSTEQEWTPESEVEIAPTEPEPVEESTQESESGELDEIELRAAALLERMAAKRAQAAATPQEPEVDLIADDTPDMEEPDQLPAEPTEEFQAPAEEEDADEAVPTQWLPADLVSDVQQPVPEPEPDAEPEPGKESLEDAVVAPTESFESAPAMQDVQEAAPAAEERTKALRRPAPPPWQTPSSAMAAEIEEVVMDAAVAQPEPAPESPEPPTQQGPLIPGPQPPLPPAQTRRRPRAGSRPPWPPPPPPGPFPPPPWWPGPPPGQRVSPAPRPAASAQPPRAAQPKPPRAPQPTPPPGRPQPPVGGPPPGYQPFRMPPSIDEAEIANPDRFAPPSGWRRAVHKATGGHVNPGASRKERQQDHLLAEIRQPIVGDFRIAVLSIKGGVGKTTTTFGLGSALATVRHDRVIAVDANPDRGTLGERVGDLSTRSTVRDLLSDPNINRYADVRNHTLMATSRLEVLASEQDPAVSEVFGADDYRRTVDILRHYYNIILTDCGTGIMHSAMSAVLDLAHTIVLVSSPAIDAARSASATLDWLMQHGHSGLVREAHVVLSASRPGSAALKLDKVYEHFQSRCRSIHLIPFDPHLAEGADVDFGRLNPATRQAYLELAGAVAENFGRLRAPREQA
ncbi:MinD/ParA family protein [Mycobacterium sp. TY814]|uniref:MinD/ParA family ATP-binding protein n=1 Tax=unclassified Mycobacterium TaxID=2642494 RepID=UPI00274248E1|nr:AAA family ATPase [Mycobacterium sp. TY814]MDP7723547.1 AAA family ATPase [Mycobacterium sp. TY814]